MEEINTVLIVDDNKTTLKLNKWLLNDFFPEEKIHMETSGTDAINFLKRCLKEENASESRFPLLIFCDVYMPDINGWELIDFLKSNKEFDMYPIYIVFMSAYVHSKEVALKCKGNNVTCINKPLTDENIEQIMSNFALSF